MATTANEGATGGALVSSQATANAPTQSNQLPPKSDEEESDEEDRIIEESPCGRWQKRTTPVTQRDVPGIDAAFLAMDTEEGVEVVWNEVRISENKRRNKNIKQVFENLIRLAHINIIKCHAYWIDEKVAENMRIIFITEYMTSGSLKNFLKKSRTNKTRFKSWRRWCSQILSALVYLHSCDPPIVHGYLTCDTIFIQHNGLIKIGSVAPDFISANVKTCRDREVAKNLHYMAPEYLSGERSITPVSDIYSFGVCALEMAVLGFPSNGDSGRMVPRDEIDRCLASLEDDAQRDFLGRCLEVDPLQRPQARDLLFHQALREVPNLRLLCAHRFVDLVHLSATNRIDAFEEELEKIQDPFKPDNVFAETSIQGQTVQQLYRQCPPLELTEYLGDVADGFYPLSAQLLVYKQPQRTRPSSPERESLSADTAKSQTPEPSYPAETRRIVQCECEIKRADEPPAGAGHLHPFVNNNDQPFNIYLNFKMEQELVRRLITELREADLPDGLAFDLVENGFIAHDDQAQVAKSICVEMERTNWPSQAQRASSTSEPGETSSTGSETTVLSPAADTFPTNAPVYPVGRPRSQSLHKPATCGPLAQLANSSAGGRRASFDVGPGDSVAMVVGAGQQRPVVS